MATELKCGSSELRCTVSIKTHRVLKTVEMIIFWIEKVKQKYIIKIYFTFLLTVLNGATRKLKIVCVAYILFLLDSAGLDALEINIMGRDSDTLHAFILPLKYSRHSINLHKTPVKRIGNGP